mmetsp:Transcript_101512/g.291026  ORF Transcript_101512/g.291026 Transcript_101512/m.291026 type:complete len:204 (-) Transcript_101512:348-959(-)
MAHAGPHWILALHQRQPHHHGPCPSAHWAQLIYSAERRVELCLGEADELCALTPEHLNCVLTAPCRPPRGGVDEVCARLALEGGLDGGVYGGGRALRARLVYEPAGLVHDPRHPVVLPEVGPYVAGAEGEGRHARDPLCERQGREHVRAFGAPVREEWGAILLAILSIERDRLGSEGHRHGVRHRGHVYDPRAELWKRLRALT